MQTHITLYCSQPTTIVQTIQKGHTHYAKLAYIKEKYGDQVAPIFINAYQWFTRQGEQLVTKPKEAESAIWAYQHLYQIEQHPNYAIMALEIPLDQAIFFAMSDWSTLLNQRFMGLTDEENQNFANKLEKQGITYEGDLFRTSFYPLLKQEVIKSWSNLFRWHQAIYDAFAQNKEPPIKDVQAALWQVPSDWVKEIIPYH